MKTKRTTYVIQMSNSDGNEWVHHSEHDTAKDRQWMFRRIKAKDLGYTFRKLTRVTTISDTVEK